jgi:hypothetical protein
VTPEFHTVSRGDTLWDISGYYFENPWRWPGVWSRNPQITNPHWIFPGDQVRLLRQGEVPRRAPVQPSSPSASRATASCGRRRGTRAAPSSSAKRPGPRPRPWRVRAPSWARPTTTCCSPRATRSYIEFQRRAPNVGETYTIYSEAQATRGSDRDAGRVVRVLGSAVVDAWDPQRHLGTARITESIDTIERGERVAIVQRQFQPVPPTPNDRDLVGHIVATPIPRAIVGRDFVVIIDRGEQDGVQPRQPASSSPSATTRGFTPSRVRPASCGVRSSTATATARWTIPPAPTA